MKLLYKATSADGTVSTGTMEAKDVNEAAFYLRSKALLPISIRVKPEESFFSLSNIFNRQSGDDIVVFTRQLSSILTSGLTLMQGLSILKDQMQNDTMKNIVASIIADVQEGKPFSFAIAKSPFSNTKMIP